MQIQELKKKYDGKSVGEIEQTAKASEKLSLSNRKEFIYALYYLERTKRFRESEPFKASTFQVYLFSVFGISSSVYEREKKAFISFPEESVKHGVGVVAKVMKECGPIRAGKALKEISKAKTATPQLVDAVIKRNTPADIKTPKKATVSELQRSMSDKDREIDRLCKIVESQRIELAEKDDQIERLKAALISAKEELSAIHSISAKVAECSLPA